MKNIQTFIHWYAVAVVILFCALILPAQAATTENFESYSNGNNMNTLNGGVDWFGAWTKNSAIDMTISNGAVCPDTLCLNGDNAADQNIYREFSGGGESAFEMQFDFARNNDDVSSDFLSVCSDGNTTCDVTSSAQFGLVFRRNTFADVLFYADGANVTSIGAYTVNTTTHIKMQFGPYEAGGCSAGQARAKLVPGGWATCTAVGTGNDPATIIFDSGNSASKEFYVDNINISVSVASTAPAVALSVINGDFTEVCTTQNEYNTDSALATSTRSCWKPVDLMTFIFQEWVVFMGTLIFLVMVFLIRKNK